MSAIVCGKRSNFFEESASPPPVSSKRLRFSSSPTRFSPPRSAAAGGAGAGSLYNNLSASLDHLVALFPGMDKELLTQALEACGDDLDSAIRSLNELRLSSVHNSGSATSNEEVVLPTPNHILNEGETTNNGAASAAQDPSADRSLHMDRAEWVDLFVREMMSASNIDDAKARASRALEALENSIVVGGTSADITQSTQQENIILKQQLQALVQENSILKRAVSIQHERQKEYEDKNQELHHLKQMVSQYQEQLRTLEVNNYALTMHLKQAQQNSSMPGRYNPDVF